VNTDELIQGLTRFLSLSEDDRDINALAVDVADALRALFDANFATVFRRQSFGNGLTLFATSRATQGYTPSQEYCLHLASDLEARKVQSDSALDDREGSTIHYNLPLFLSWVAKDPFAHKSQNAFSALIFRNQRKDEADILSIISLVEIWLADLFSRCLARSRRDRRIEFLQHLTEIPSSDIDRVFSTLLESFTQAVPCRFIDLWLYNDLDDTLVIRSFAPATLDDVAISFSHFDSQVLKRTDSLTGVVIQTGNPTIFHKLGQPFRNPLFAERLNLKWLMSLPLSPAADGNPLGILNIWPEGSPEDFGEDTLELLMAYVAPVPAAVRLSYLLFQESLVEAYDNLFERMLVFSDQEDWWNDLARLVRDHMRCEGCSIFLRGKDDRLYLRGTTGLERVQKTDTVFYERGIGLTGMTFETGRPQIYHVELAEEFGSVHRSVHREKTTGKSKSILLVPIVGASGGVDGVLRCNNKREIPARQVGRFTREDLAHLRQIAKLISNLHSRALWLRAREEERSRAITSLGHELKAPVSTFMRHAEWLTRFAPESMKGEQGARFRLKLEDIHRNSQLLSLLVSNITDIDDIVLDPSEVRAVKLVERCLSCVYDEARAAKIDFLTGEIAINWFVCDELQMMRVLFNLVRNAVKYCDRAEVGRYVAVGARKERGFWIVSIRDNGIGVPDGEEDEIFAQYKRGSNAAAVYPQGTGLGLYFCKRIAEAHGGGIRLIKYRKPTQFEVYWPTRQRGD
jgi:signal transduction histidine kinase